MGISLRELKKKVYFGPLVTDNSKSEFNIRIQSANR